MYKHILVPTDGTRLSAKAVKAAARLAKQIGARISGVYVIPPYVPPMYGEAAIYVPEITPKRYKELSEKEARKALAAGDNGSAVALFVRSVGVSDKQVEAMRHMPMWNGLEKLAPTLAYDSEGLGEGHALPAALLSRVRTPTLVMHGGAGSPAMRDAALAISEAIPRAELRTLARQTHGVSPTVLAPVLEEFFA